MSGKPQIHAVLLAAGRSRRMGAFKPLLPFGDASVVETCVRRLCEGGVETVVVVVGHRADEVRSQLAHLPVSFAVNHDPASEMGASIMRGVEIVPCQAAAIFVALCDQPAIPAAVIGSLIEERRRTGARLVVPEYEGCGGHPVLIDSCFRKELLNLDPERGLRAFFDAHRSEVRRAPVNSRYVVLDMDTWDDYRAIYQEVFGLAPPGISPPESD